MEIYMMTRPSLSPMPACAPLFAAASLPVVPAAAVAVVEALGAERAPAPITHKVVTAARTAPISRVHQVQLQAELTLGRGGSDGINGTTGTTSTTGFKGSDVAKKRYADGSGVPPRGRPV